MQVVSAVDSEGSYSRRQQAHSLFSRTGIARKLGPSNCYAQSFQGTKSRSQSHENIAQFVQECQDASDCAICEHVICCSKDLFTIGIKCKKVFLKKYHHLNGIPHGHVKEAQHVYRARSCYKPRPPDLSIRVPDLEERKSKADTVHGRHVRA